MSDCSSPNRNSARVRAVSVLPTPDGPRKMNEPLGRLGSLSPARVRRMARRHRLDGLVLADDPLVQLVLHAEQLLGLLLGELVDGDAGPDGQDLGDGLLVDLVEEIDAGRLDLGLLGLLLAEQLLLLVAERAGLLEALGLDGLLLLADDLGDLVLDLLVVRRRLHALDAQAGAGLVDQVDGLVGQVPVGDVAVGQVGGRDQGLVGDGDPVVLLVAVPEALEDLDGVRHRRLVDLDGLEATLQGGVLLEVLAVLVEGGGADGLQLAPGQHGLEDRGGVDGAFGGAGADQGVQLVDEQDDVAAGADLLEHLLEPLLEVTPVARAGDEGAEVEGVELLAGERLGHVVGGDGLGQAFDDGGLADAGLADEHRVVLGAPAEHLHDPLGLADPADDGVELLVTSQLREVAPELVEHERAGLAALAAGPGTGGRAGLLAGLAWTAVPGQQLDDLLADPGKVRAQLDQHLGSHALALTDEAEQDVLGADVVVAELQRLSQRQLQHLLGAGGEGDVAAGRRAALADDLLHLAADGLERDAEGLEGLGGHALALVDEPEQDVLGADVVVVEQSSFLLGQHDDSTGSVSEPFEQGKLLPPLGSWRESNRTP